MQTSVSIRGLVFSTLFSALLVASSYLNVPLPFTPIPITLENLIIMVAAAVLGPFYGLLSVLLVVVLTTAGLPLLHGKGGLLLILGPTGGFIWAYPLAALLIGWLAGKVKGSGPWAIIRLILIMELFGSLLLYVTGVPWLAHVAKIPFAKAMVVGCYPYLLGDAVKAVVAALLVVPIRKVFPAARLR